MTPDATFSAVREFGAPCDIPGVQAYLAALVASVSEFDGQPITPELIERVNMRVVALQKIMSEF